jgi:hypothetical protein
MKNLSKVLWFLLLLTAHETVLSATRTALSSGRWEQSSRWSGGQLPACGDSIVINSGITVEVTSLLDFSLCNAPLHLKIKGTLTFQTGKKLRLPCNSSVTIETGGLISGGGGGGNSNLIDICNVTVWNAAQGNLPGPVVLQLNPLPIDLAYFSVRPESDGITLSWITLSEINNSHYVIEKGKDGVHFEELTTVPGAGTTTHLSSYLVTDKNPFEGLQYYRLRQVDIDGKSTLSSTLAVKWNSLHVFQIYPNPSTGELFANIDPQLIGQTGKLIINRSDGKLHMLRDIKVETTSYGVKLLKNREFLKPGSYMISLNFKNHNYSQMVIAK